MLNPLIYFVLNAWPTISTSTGRRAGRDPRRASRDAGRRDRAGLLGFRVGVGHSTRDPPIKIQRSRARGVFFE